MKTIRKSPFLQTIVLLFLLPAFAWLPTSVQSNPSGEIVIHGDVEFEADGDTLRIMQESDKSIIHWENFSIGSGESTIFEMPGESSASLNRVTGSGLSAIDGLLQANGNVWVINPNGIIVGPNGNIDAAGITLSTLDIDDNNFLQGGQYHFRGGSTAPIINHGTVKTADRGEIFVVAHDIQQEGYMGAPDGRIILAGGSDVLINSGPNGAVFINSTVAGGAHITHNGVSEAAEIGLHARNGNAFGMAVQINGTLRATNATNDGGRIKLVVEGGGGINVGPTAVLEASGLTGGSIEAITDGAINIGSPNIRANGETTGGDIQVIGGQIEFLPGAGLEANGGVDGGNVRVGSDGSDGNAPTAALTLPAGSALSANGGNNGGSVSMATSGTLVAAGSVNSSGAAGDGGTVNFAGHDVLIPEGALVNASGGNNGGNVVANAVNNMFIDGTIDAGGTNGTGGTIVLNAGDNLLASQTSFVGARGASGGTIVMNAGGELYLAGAVDASGTDGPGGTIDLTGEDIVVPVTGSIRADGTDGGGTISATAGDQLIIHGQMSADGGDGTGGMISMTGTDILVGPTARISANGADGGNIGIMAQDSLEVFGVIEANGSVGNGGSITLNAADMLIGPTARVSANGEGDGGRIALDASGDMVVSGVLSANGANGNGGYVAVTGDNITVNPTARISANGGNTGGQVFIGGGFQGGQGLRQASNVNILAGSQISANGGNGSGGVVALWSQGDMNFQGSVDVGGGLNGGVAEVSGVQSLTFDGDVNLAGLDGSAGTLLLDPVNVTVGNGDPGEIAAAAVVAALGTGNVIVHTAAVGTPDPGENGNITIEGGSQLLYTSPYSLSFFANGDFIMGADPTLTSAIINGGTGNINVVAGWDQSTAAVDPTTLLTPAQQTHTHETVTPIQPNGTGSLGRITAADILAGTFGAWGQNGGTIRFEANTDVDSVMAIGSAHGETNAFAYNFQIETGNERERAQFGFPTFSGLGLPNLETTSAIGTQLVGNSTFFEYEAADTTVDLVGGTSAPIVGDTLDFGAGHAGVYTITAVNGTSFTLDRGLDAAVGNNAAVTVNAVAAGSAATNDFTTGLEERNNPNAGDINIYASNNFIANAGRRSSVQIGHGASGQSNWGGGIRNGDLNGDITVNVEETFSMIGGSDRTGNIHVGHGGWISDWGGQAPQEGNKSGDIDVQANVVLMTQANSRLQMAQIGHGGRRQRGNMSGDINVVGTNGVLIGRPDYSNADRRRVYAQIGHGGFDIIGNSNGNIDVVGGSIQFTGGQDEEAYGMIGHGGRSVRGEAFGHINVTATLGNVEMYGANSLGRNAVRGFAQIGHGGYDADHVNARPIDNPLGPNGAGTTVGEGMTTVDILNAQNAAEGGRFDDITAMIDPSPFYQAAGFGDVYRPVGNAGNINVIAAGSIVLRAGARADSYAQIGHGGRSTLGEQGGWDMDNADGDNDWRTGRDGDITVIAQNGSITMDRFIQHGVNTGERAYVQIGHGGYFGNAGAQGNIRVEAHNGNIEAYGGVRDDAFAQIGHGGRSQSWGAGDTPDTAAIRHPRAANDDGAFGNLEGDITVYATGNLKFRSGFWDAVRAWSAIGHGGYGQAALPHMGHNGDIDVQVGGYVDFYAGFRSRADHEVSVLVGGADQLLPGMLDATLTGNGSDNWTQIGHFGRDHARSNSFGNIGVVAGVNPFAGTSSLGANIAPSANAFISLEGTGGWDGLSSYDDQGGGANSVPTYGRGDDGGLSGERNWAMIGHGGNDTEGRNTDDDRGRNGSYGIGIGALGYWYDDLTGQYVAPTIFGTLDDGSNGGIAGDRMNDAIMPNNGNTDGLGWVIPWVGFNPRLLDPANAADAALIRTSNINVSATGDVRIVAPQFDPANPMRRDYDIAARRAEFDGFAVPTYDHDGDPLTAEIPVWDEDDLLALFDTTRTMTGRNNPGWTADVPLALVQSAREGFAQIGHGGISYNQEAFDGNRGLEAGYGIYGDITVSAGGDVKVLAGDFIRELAPGESPDQFRGITQYDFDGDGVGAIPLYRTANMLAQDIGSSSTSLNGVTQGSVETRDLYAQIGHGGRDANSHMRGNISITSTGGGLEVKAGESLRSWAQVGHGGEHWNIGGNGGNAGTGSNGRRNVPNNIEGTISIDVTGDIELTAGQQTFAYAQIGHGGVEWRDDDDPNQNNANNFDAFNDILTITNSDISVISRQGGVSIRNRSFVDGFFSQVQYNFNNNPDIIVLNNATMLQDGLAHAVIGHGSYDGEVNVGEFVDGQLIGGNISVRAEGGNVQIGALPDPTGNPNMAPMQWRSPMQIGHYMSFADRTTPNTILSLLGDIEVYAAGDVTLRAGDSPRIVADINAQQAFGARDGINIYADGGLYDSDIRRHAFAANDLTDYASLYYPTDIDSVEFDSYAQIGHGGMTNGSWAGRAGMRQVGDITVTANRAAVADDPDTPADETAPAAMLVLDAGDGTGAHASIGHTSRRARHGEGVIGDIDVNVSGDTFLIGGERFLNGGVQGLNFRLENKANNATIGHNIQTQNERSGDAEGNISLNTGGDLTMIAGFGDAAHVRIGNGSNINYQGDPHQGTFIGDIAVTVGGDLLMRGGGLNNSIDPDNGLGSTGSGTPLPGFSLQEDGPSTLGENAFNAELGNRIAILPAQFYPDDTYAQIGNGGNGVNGVLQGDIVLTVGGSGTLERGNSFVTLFASTGPYIEGSAPGGTVKIGHGDWLFDSPVTSGNLTREGSITASFGEDLTLTGAQIGHHDQRVGTALAIAGNTTVSTGRNGVGGTLTVQSAPHRQGVVDPGGNPDIGTLADTGFGVSSISSAIGGELRFYIPEHHDGIGPALGGALGNGGHLDIAAGTLFNNSTYIRHTAEPIGGPFRADETLQVEAGFTFTNPDLMGADTGGNFVNALPDWAPTPLGLYPAHGFGNYNVYFGDSPVVPGVPPGGGGPLVPGAGGGGGDGLAIEEEVVGRRLLDQVVPIITQTVDVGKPVIQTGLTPLQLSLISGFNSSGIQFEIGRGLQTNAEGSIGDTTSPTTDDLIVFFETGDGRIFAVTGQGTFYVTDPADPFNLTPAGELEIVDIQEAMNRRKAPDTDGSDGTVGGEAPPADPFLIDPGSMDGNNNTEEEDENEDDNGGGFGDFDMGEPAVNTGNPGNGTVPAGAPGEFDF